MSPKPVDDFPEDDGHRLAFIHQKIEETRTARESAMRDYNNRIKDLEALEKRICHKILTGQTDMFDEEEVEPVGQGERQK